MAAPKEKKESPPLSFAASVVGIESVLRYADEHPDELLMNGGNLSPEMQVLLDGFIGSAEERVDAIAATLRHAEGREFTAKAAAAANAQWAKAHRNLYDGLRRYAQFWTERVLSLVGGNVIKGATARFAVYDNKPKAVVDFSQEELRAAFRHEPETDNYPEDTPEAFPLIPYMSAEIVVSIDDAALLQAYELRKQLIESTIPPVKPDEIPLDELERVVANAQAETGAQQSAAIAAHCQTVWEARVQQDLEKDFPRVRVERSKRLVITKSPAGGWNG
jgi:hypothetical protein